MALGSSRDKLLPEARRLGWGERIYFGQTSKGDEVDASGRGVYLKEANDLVYIPTLLDESVIATSCLCSLAVDFGEATDLSGEFLGLVESVGVEQGSRQAVRSERVLESHGVGVGTVLPELDGQTRVADLDAPAEPACRTDEKRSRLAGMPIERVRERSDVVGSEPKHGRSTRHC